jgi:predicted methyltransferase
MRLTLKTAIAFLLTCSTLSASAQDDVALRERVLAALHNDALMSAEEQAREAERQPADVLSFFRLRDDMKVMELLPFGGWYSKILAQVLQGSGKLYVTQPEVGGYSEDMRAMLARPGMEEVEEIPWGRTASAGSSPWGASGTWNVEPLDLVLTFRNYHNFGYDDRMAINKSAFDALKSGGYYGIVDHTRRHMQADSRANGRRVDPVLVIKEVQDSGFVLEDYSTVLSRPQDELVFEVGQPEVAGQTDRFVLLFRKP